MAEEFCFDESAVSQYRHENGAAAFLPPFQGSSWVGDCTQGSVFGSTLGYIPAAASRLKVFAISPDLNVMHDTLEGCFRKRPWWR